MGRYAYCDTFYIYRADFTLIVWMTYTPRKDFDQTKWQTDKKDRFQMANDIIKTNMLVGKDTNQVKQILGIPTWG
jgi:nicotinic acid mononucleotide adenylyltransferase